MPGRRRRSCDTCNGQKLRCCGQRPACTRCRRLNRSCVYRPSAGAGAGAGAAGSAGSAGGHASPASAEHAVAISAPPPPQSPLPAAPPSAPLPPRLPHLPPAPALTQHIPEKRYLGVPEALLPPLIDVYYTYLYNASLLMHRPSLDRMLAAGTVRADVLLSICALAAKFYADARGAHVLVENHFARDWAEAAGRMALREFEAPSGDNVVAFLNLSLFWYSTGDFQRSNMHCASAASTTWVLGVPRSAGGGAGAGGSNANNDGNDNNDNNLLAAEIRRRRFWACYLLCAFQWDSLFPKAPTEAILRLNLPCSEGEFRLAAPPAGVPLGEEQAAASSSSPSIYAELVRAMALWSSVVVLIKQQAEWTLAQRLVEMQKLDARIHAARAAVQEPPLRLDVATMAAVPRYDLPRLLLVHIVYHQCFCSLHSSMVPLFSLEAVRDAPSSSSSSPSSSTSSAQPPPPPPPPVVPSYAQQLSAQTAFEHANAVSDLLREALRLEDWDPARMPSFIGYAAYCACAIQMPFLWCAHPDVRRRAQSSILANLQTLQVLGRHWAFLKLLGRFACGLYRVHAAAPHALTDEPKNMAPGVLRGGFAKAAHAARARLSILTHNTIIVSDQGSTVKAVDDIGDIVDGGSVGGGGGGGGEGDGSDSSDGPAAAGGPASAENIADFMSQLSREAAAAAQTAPVPMTSSQVQMIADAFVPAEGLGFYGHDGRGGGGRDVNNTFGWVMGGPQLDQFGLLEDQITELLQRGEWV